jgi:hypothetical protein
MLFARVTEICRTLPWSLENWSVKVDGRMWWRGYGLVVLGINRFVVAPLILLLTLTYSVNAGRGLLHGSPNFLDHRGFRGVHIAEINDFALLSELLQNMSIRFWESRKATISAGIEHLHPKYEVPVPKTCLFFASSISKICSRSSVDNSSHGKERVSGI